MNLSKPVRLFYSAGTILPAPASCARHCSSIRDIKREGGCGCARAYSFHRRPRNRDTSYPRNSSQQRPFCPPVMRQFAPSTMRRTCFAQWIQHPICRASVVLPNCPPCPVFAAQSAAPCSSHQQRLPPRTEVQARARAVSGGRRVAGVTVLPARSHLSPYCQAMAGTPRSTSRKP